MLSSAMFWKNRPRSNGHSYARRAEMRGKSDRLVNWVSKHIMTWRDSRPPERKSRARHKRETKSRIGSGMMPRVRVALPLTLNSPPLLGLSHTFFFFLSFHFFFNNTQMEKKTTFSWWNRRHSCLPLYMLLNALLCVLYRRKKSVSTAFRLAFLFYGGKCSLVWEKCATYFPPHSPQLLTYPLGSPFPPVLRKKASPKENWGVSEWVSEREKARAELEVIYEVTDAPLPIRAKIAEHLSLYQANINYGVANQ